MPARKVLIAWLAGAGAAGMTVLCLGASGDAASSGTAIVGGVLVGLAVMLVVALVLDDL